MSSGEAESSRGPEEGDAPARKGPWVVLSAVVRVVSEEEEQAGNLTAGADIEFELHDAPRPSILLLRERVFADLDLGDNYPYVVATHPAGGFLVHATTRSPGAADSVSVLLLCDAHARTATRLPTCDLPAFELSKFPIGSVGLLNRFVPTSTAGYNPLVIYSTATGAWATADLRFSPIVPARWRPDRSFDHAGELWWVDAAYGLTAFNLFDDKPRVRFIPLPAAYQVVDDEPPRRDLIDGQRFFGVSEGEIRFVACESVTALYLWELYVDGWMLKNRVQFTDIWADAAGVPHKGVAMLGFVNPHHTELYLRRGGAVFAIDMDEVQPRGRKVCEGPVDVHPHDELHNRSSFVETWDLLSGICQSFPFLWETERRHLDDTPARFTEWLLQGLFSQDAIPCN